MGSWDDTIMGNDTAMDREWIISEGFESDEEHVDWRDLPERWLKAWWYTIEQKFIKKNEDVGFSVCAFVGICRGMNLRGLVMRGALRWIKQEEKTARDYRDPDRRGRRLAEFKRAIEGYKGKPIHLEKIEERAETDEMTLTIHFSGDKVYMDRKGDLMLGTEQFKRVRIRKQEVLAYLRKKAIELMLQFDFAQNDKMGEISFEKWLGDSSIKWYKELKE